MEKQFRPLAARQSAQHHTGTREHVVGSLSARTLGAVSPEVCRPTYDRAALRPGVVHLGVGAFHRAHQAVYFDRLAEIGASRDWGVVGVGMRRSSCRTELLAQDCLYTVLELGQDEPRARVVGALQNYLSLSQQPAATAAVLRAPETQLVTVTITAPSYGEGRATPTFDLLAAALDDRRRAGVAPFTVVSCDNLPGNGEVTRDRVLAAAARRGPALVRWIETHVAFPNSMVDRITPPASEHDSRLLRRRFGLHDRALVVTEPFTQWVLEDRFSGERPPLELAGVQMVSDVAPYVSLKMSMLNAAHVALGYLGAGTQLESTDAAMHDLVLGRAVERMLAEEVQRTLDPVPGIDVDSYRESVLARLRNPAIADPLCRLRRRGSVRVRNYVLPSIERSLAKGRRCPLLVSVVAAWVAELHRSALALESGLTTHADLAAEMEDPDGMGLLVHARTAPEDVRPLLAAAPGFERLSGSRYFVQALQTALTHQEGARRVAS